jgi:hypothetical protein
MGTRCGKKSKRKDCENMEEFEEFSSIDSCKIK